MGKKARTGWECRINGTAYQVADQPTYNGEGIAHEVTQDSAGKQGPVKERTTLPAIAVQILVDETVSIAELTAVLSGAVTVELYCFSTKTSVSLADTYSTEVPQESDSMVSLNFSGGVFTES